MFLLCVKSGIIRIFNQRLTSPCYAIPWAIMPDIIRFFDRAGVSGAEKVSITQKKLKNYIKLFDTAL